MKLQFDASLDYQTEAVRAVCDVFKGQEVCQTLFTVARDRLPQAELFNQDGTAANAGDSDLGIGNRLKLLDDEIAANVRRVQLRL